MYVSSDPEDYQKEYKDSLMYKYVDLHFNSILLNITIPPGPEATPTTIEEGIIVKIISINEINKGKERSNINLYCNYLLFNTEIQVQVNKRLTLAQLKEELVPLIGVPPTGFRVYINDYIIRYNLEYEIKLDETLKLVKSGSEVVY